MKVFLMADVPGTGKKEEVVTVSDGYARNYLFPRKLAKEMTPALERELKDKADALARRRAINKEAAEGIAKRIKDLKVTVRVKTGENGKLFGSVSSKEVADALKEQHGIEVDKKKIEMPSKIAEKGVYQIPVKLFTGVSSVLNVEVTGLE